MSDELRLHVSNNHAVVSDYDDLALRRGLSGEFHCFVGEVLKIVERLAHSVRPLIPVGSRDVALLHLDEIQGAWNVADFPYCSDIETAFSDSVRRETKD